MVAAKSKSASPPPKHMNTPGSEYANGSVAAHKARVPSASRPRDMSSSLLLHNVSPAGAAGNRSFSGKDIGGFYSLKE